MLADLLMVFHLLWAAFMILGLPLGHLLGSTALRRLHFAGMTATAFFAAAGLYCPLTVWEEDLRWGAGLDPALGDSFIVRILTPVLYPDLQPWMVRAASICWWVLSGLFLALTEIRGRYGGRRR